MRLPAQRGNGAARRRWQKQVDQYGAPCRALPGCESARLGVLGHNFLQFVPSAGEHACYMF